MKLRFKSTISITIALLYTFLQVFTTSASSLTNNISAPEIISPFATLIDANTGVVIYDKNMNDRISPASTTKIMTALLTIEYADGDFDKRITFSNEAVFGIERGSSHISMDVDETLSLNEALYAILLASANEVSAALAENIGGSIEDFAVMMNDRAKELGATDTNFVNPHGLDDENHYSTVHDLALIMKEVIKYDKFNEIIATKQSSIPYTEKNPEQKILNNSNKLIYNGNYYYEYNIGGKTGYTDTARHTLVSYSKKDDMELIAVIAQAEKNEPYSDSIILYDYGFSIYENIHLLTKSDYSTEYIFYSDDGNKQLITLEPKEDVDLYLPNIVDAKNIVLNPVHDSTIKTKPSNGDALGYLELMYVDNIIGSVDLIVSDVKTDIIPISNSIDMVSSKDSGKKSNSSGILNIIKTIMLFLVILVALSIIFIFSFRSYNIYKRKCRYERSHSIKKFSNR